MMKLADIALSRQLLATGLAFLLGSSFVVAQISPAEIHNPQLKALEKTHLTQLVDLNRQISTMKFPFPFIPSRYVGLDPKDQPGTDRRGLEFVRFQDRTVLKVSGNYNAAFNADLLTANQRANRVLDDVIVPILAQLVRGFPHPTDFDAFGFEVSYHVRRRAQRYGYEGRENFVVVFDNQNASAFLKVQNETQKQEILSASATFVDGKELGLALGERDSIPLEGVAGPEQREVSKAAGKEDSLSIQPEARPLIQTPAVRSAVPEQELPPGLRSRRVDETLNAIQLSRQSEGAAAVHTQAEVDALQNKLQPQLDALAKEGAAKFHFVEYAPSSLALFHDQIYLQLTLRNPALFDQNSTSIYKRAARSFDLFLAPSLKDLLAKIPDSPEIAGLDITVLDQFAANASSSEALEFICPLSSLRQFTDYTITNQDLINQSIVLVNGVRISLNLQQVE
jgi:hypothetical protein